MLAARNIKYNVDGRQILDGCSITIEPRKFTAILGSNGAGKSTLLKVITKEAASYSGAVEINQQDAGRVSSKKLAQLRAVMPQHSDINFPFTIEQVIEIGRFMHHSKPEENARIMDEVISIAMLDDYRGRIYQTLSGGEKQRVQLARVMAQIWDESNSPRYLLLDEPTSDLDIRHQHAILNTSRELMSKNIGVLAVLHDLNLAAHYADNVVFMKNGTIVEHGPTEQVFTKENIEKTFDHPVELIREARTGKSVVMSLPKYLMSQNVKVK